MRKIFAIITINLLFVITNLFANDYSEYKIVIRFKSNVENQSELIKQIEKRFGLKSNRVLTENLSTKNPERKNEILSRRIDVQKLISAENELLRSYTLVANQKIDPFKLCKQIKSAYDCVELAEPICNYKVLGYIPNDAFFINQSTLLKIKAPEAWEIWKGDPYVVVAVSDNGVFQNHEDLTGNIYINEGEIPNNGLDDDKNGYIDDFRGFNFAGAVESQGWGGTYGAAIDHGTMVAGICSAHFDNQKGIAGIGGKCRLFPIKASGKSSDAIEFGNESIIFAAVHGFKVLNLSWGGPRPFSEFEQSVINFAIANDVAIVAAGGNIGTNGGTRYDTFYPAGYFGVLGVGEVDEFDEVTTQTSALGPQVAIMAPGEGNYSTKNNGSYGYVGGGTSFATPIVSGAVALARSKYPELNAIQALEFVRQCGDDILENNSTNIDKQLIPKRINLLKVVTTNPFSIPAIKPIKYLYKNTSNQVQDRFSVGDTVRLQINVKNYLGDAKSLKFTLSAAYDPAKSINILTNQLQLPLIRTNEETFIGDFVFYINKENTSKVIFRVDIQSENDYKDMFKFEFIPTKTYATFESDSVIFSMSDDGKFGFIELGSVKEGSGFTVKGKGNQLYGQSGLLISENNDKLLSFYFDSFKPIKRFIQPNPNQSIINDDFANSINKIGLEISQKVSFPLPNIAQIDIKIQNKSGRTLKLLSVGNFYDWDILDKSDSNYAELYTEINSNQERNSFGGLGAEIIYKPGEDFYLGCVAYSNYHSEPQIAGAYYDFTRSFAKEIQLQLLNSGLSIQYDKVDDRSIFAGIRFVDPIADGAERDLSLLIGYSQNRDELTKDIINVLKMNSAEEHRIISDQPIKIFSDTKQNLMQILIPENFGEDYKIEIYDMFGKLINYVKNNESRNSGFVVNLLLPIIENQVIFVKVTSSLHNSTNKLIWIK